VGAIDFEQGETWLVERVGAIIVATGYGLYPLNQLAEYGAGLYADVIDALAFERLLSASGPTMGKIQRPSDGKVPKEVVFVQCAGSRDTEKGVPYCSKVCCMQTAKQAVLYRHRVPDGLAYVFYIDIRSGGKGHEQFVARAMEEERILYLRSKVSKVFEEDGQVMVWGADTISGKPLEIVADLVILATALCPREDTRALGAKLGLPVDRQGFLAQRHAEARPVESGREGIYLAGAVLGPKDVSETVTQASAAAAKVLGLFARWKRE